MPRLTNLSHAQLSIKYDTTLARFVAHALLRHRRGKLRSVRLEVLLDAREEWSIIRELIYENQAVSIINEVISKRIALIHSHSSR